MKRGKQTTLPMLAAIGTLVTAAGLLVAPTAHAQPTTSPTMVVHRTATTTAARTRVTHYWTSARMRAARPLARTPGANWKPGRVATGKPTVIQGSKRQTQPNVVSASYLGGPWTNGGRVTKTTGRVFMTLNGVDYACSGSVVPAANKSLVTTAGHCVNEGPGAFVSNFEFVPGYNNGRAPYGVWAATSVATTRQWARQGNFSYDVGFAVVAPRSGKYLDNVVGTQGIGFNQPRGQETYAFGYPAEGAYNGERLDYSSGVTGNDQTGQTSDLRLRSNMTGGCSGGPWLEKFNTSTGVGIQISVNSFGYVGQKNQLYGPYFGTAIQNVYNQVQSAT